MLREDTLVLVSPFGAPALSFSTQRMLEYAGWLMAFVVASMLMPLLTKESMKPSVPMTKLMWSLVSV